MIKGEIEINKAAKFLPMVDEENELPCLEVAGAQVYAYVKDGTLRVSVDLDTVDESLMRADRTVPLRVSVQGNEVFAEV